MQPDKKENLKSAIKLRDSDDLFGAEQTLMEITLRNPNYGPAYLILGGIYMDLEKYEEAENSFRKVIEVKPNYPLGSIMLFHTLNDLKKYKESIDEIKRFLTYADLKYKDTREIIEEDYQEILEELLVSESHKSLSAEIECLIREIKILLR